MTKKIALRTTRSLIKVARQSIIPTLKIQNYVNLKTKVHFAELEQECNALENLLKAPASFAKNFKLRCLKRQRGVVDAISFAQSLSTATNRLYWDIAMAVFAPRSMQEMLAILLPDTTEFVDIRISEFLPPEVRTQKQQATYFKNCDVVVSVSNLEGLKSLPNFSMLGRYILEGNQLIDVSQIVVFNIGIHANANSKLYDMYPQLAKKLYQHNSDLEQLSEDISNYRNNALTPYEAIKGLRNTLTLGGEKITYKKYASNKAILAVFKFRTYLDILTSELQNRLLSLTYNGVKTLNDILLRIDLAECVEETAVLLDKYLQRNLDNALLYITPKMTRKQLRELEAKYGPQKAQLSVDKEEGDIQVLPISFLQQAIEKITIVNLKFLVDLMLAFHPSHYQMLWDNLTFKGVGAEIEDDNSDYAYDADSDFTDNLRDEVDSQYDYDSDLEYESGFNLFQSDELPADDNETTIDINNLWFNFGEVIAGGLFNDEQNQALAKSIRSNYSRFNLDDNYVIWAAKCRQIIYLKDCLENQTATEQIRTLTNTIVFEQIVTNVDCTNYIYDLLDNPTQFASLVTSLGKYRRIPLFNAFKCANSSPIKNIISKLPPDFVMSLYSLRDLNKQSILHISADNDEMLVFCLSLVPKDKLHSEIEALDNFGDSLLHLTKGNLVSIQLILSYYPDNAQKLVQLKRLNSCKQTVLSANSSNPQAMVFLLGLYPPAERFALLSHRDQSEEGKGRTIFNCLVPDESFIEIMKALPEPDKVPAFRIATTTGYKALHKFGQSEKLLNFMLSIIPQSDIPAYLRDTDEHGLTMLHYATKYGSAKAVKKLLSLYQGFSALEILLAPRYFTARPYQFNASTLGYMEVLIQQYLKDHSAGAFVRMLLSFDACGVMVLHQLVAVPNVLKLVCKYVPKTALQGLLGYTDAQGNNVLFLLCKAQKSLDHLIELLPEPQRQETWGWVDSDGISLTCMRFLCGNNIPGIQRFINYLRGMGMLQLLNVPNNMGNTVFHGLALLSRSFTAYFNLFKNKEKMPFLIQMNDNSQSVYDLLTDRQKIQATLAQMLKPAYASIKEFERILQDYSDKHKNIKKLKQFAEQIKNTQANLVLVVNHAEAVLQRYLHVYYSSELTINQKPISKLVCKAQLQDVLQKLNSQVNHSLNQPKSNQGFPKKIKVDDGQSTQAGQVAWAYYYKLVDQVIQSFNEVRSQFSSNRNILFKRVALDNNLASTVDAMVGQEPK